MNHISKNLPDCALVDALLERAQNRKDISFPFCQRLDDFRARVSAEVQFINQLFPEYTPHDEHYHLSRLFHVASKLLTQQKLAEMNSAELFVLSCGLYGHDCSRRFQRRRRDSRRRIQPDRVSNQNGTFRGISNRNK